MCDLPSLLAGLYVNIARPQNVSADAKLPVMVVSSLPSLTYAARGERLDTVLTLHAVDPRRRVLLRIKRNVSCTFAPRLVPHSPSPAQVRSTTVPQL